MAVRIYIATSFVVDETYQGLMIHQALNDYISARYPDNDPKIISLGSLELDQCAQVSKALSSNVA